MATAKKTVKTVAAAVADVLPNHFPVIHDFMPAEPLATEVFDAETVRTYLHQTYGPFRAMPNTDASTDRLLRLAAAADLLWEKVAAMPLNEIKGYFAVFTPKLPSWFADLPANESYAYLYCYKHLFAAIAKQDLKWVRMLSKANALKAAKKAA